MLDVEILAPAGDFEALKVAIWHGADAVYLSAQDFGMRSAPANFTFEELSEAVKFAHARGVKVYQTVNVLPTNSEVAKLEEFIIRSQSAGVDAIIVADVGVLMLSKRVAPDLDVHISVQMGVVNYLTATELYNLGASRVVLARELTIEEIKDIRANTPPELQIESFVHGSICMSISGRCLISKYFTDRDANHGECSQPCRWEYDIVDPRNPEKKLNVVENSCKDYEGNIVSSGSYILNSKDLNLIEYIPELASAGVYSLKIEGRAKSSFYVASCVNAYRKAVDFFKANESLADNNGHIHLPTQILEDVQKISHREYTTGFYFSSALDGNGKVVDGIYNAKSTPSSNFEKGYKQDWAPTAIKLEDGWHQRGKVSIGDDIEILAPSANYNDSITQSQTKLLESVENNAKVVKVVKITALEEPGADRKSKKNPNFTPYDLESSAHANQLLNFELVDKEGNQIDMDALPLGTFLRTRINQNKADNN